MSCIEESSWEIQTLSDQESFDGVYPMENRICRLQKNSAIRIHAVVAEGEGFTSCSIFSGDDSFELEMPARRNNT